MFVSSQRVKENTTDIIQIRRKLVEDIFYVKLEKLSTMRTAGQVCFTMGEHATTRRR